MPVQLSREITLVLYGVLAFVNVVQTASIAMPTWAHALIIGVSAGIGAILNRSQVTPVAKLKAASRAPTHEERVTGARRVTGEETF